MVRHLMMDVWCSEKERKTVFGIKCVRKALRGSVMDRLRSIDIRGGEPKRGTCYRE